MQEEFPLNYQVVVKSKDIGAAQSQTDAPNVTTNLFRIEITDMNRFNIETTDCLYNYMETADH